MQELKNGNNLMQAKQMKKFRLDIFIALGFQNDIKTIKNENAEEKCRLLNVN